MVIHFNTSSDDANELCSELNSIRNESAIAIGSNLTNQTEVESLITKVIKTTGQLDVLINNAGTNVPASVLEMTEEGYETVMGINLRAPLICAQEFARARIACGGGGSILNVTSIAGHRGFQDHLCYAASKAGLEGATRVMAKALGEYGIRVTAVAPTVTMTDLAALAWSDPAKSDPMMVRHPIGRFADVEDVASVIVMLLSNNASMVTGTILPIDGGFLAV